MIRVIPVPSSQLLKEFGSNIYSKIIEHVSDYLPKGYDDEFLKPISFETIKNNFLTEAIKGIEVKAINSSTGDKLVYPQKLGEKIYCYRWQQIIPWIHTRRIKHKLFCSFN